MSNIFEGKAVDLIRFANMPKCKNQYWQPSTGSGCLFTALWTSMGFVPSHDQDGWAQFRYGDEIFSAQEMIDKFEDFVRILLPKSCLLFTSRVIGDYDGNLEVEALNTLWELIEVLPKTSYTTKEEVVANLPCMIGQ